MNEHAITLDRLEALTNYLVDRFHQSLSVDDEDRHLAAALIVLVRSMVADARAIATLCRADQAEESHTFLRPMLEARMEIELILNGPEPRLNAVTYMIFGLLEFRDFLKAGDRSTESADERLAVLRREFPDVAAQLESARAGKRRPLYWSGKSRKAIIRELYPDHPKMMDLYTFFSWDAHQIMTGVFDVHIDESGPEPLIQFGPRQPQEEAAAFGITLAHNMLGDTWDRVAPALKVKAWENKMEPRSSD